MTIKIIDAAFETTTTTGTGDITLAGALAGFRPFSSAGNGAYVAYQINDGNAAGVVTQREVGIGIITVGNPNTLKRSKILYSTNSNQAVNFGTGTKNVLGSIPADILALRDENLNFLEGFGTASGTATAHTVALPVAPLAYSDGMRIYYYVTVTNTGAFTVNVNTLGNKSAKFAGADPAPGLVTAGSLITLVYNTSTGFFDIQPSAAMVASGPVGQCRLVRSGANLALQPFNGNRLTINGLPQSTPPGGVTLPATGLATGTVYYIYAYMNAGVMGLEASTTGHATDAATGVEIKTGDASRALVGMGWTSAAATWGGGVADVASWFNRRPVTVSGAFAANRATTTTVISELSSEIRANFLSWGDAASAKYSGAQSHSVANGSTFSIIELDGTAIISSGIGSTTSGYVNGGSSGDFTPSEGRHYVTLFVAVQTAGTGTWYAQNTVPGSGVLQATVQI